MNLHDRDITRAAKREGVLQGEQKKAIEAAITLVQKYKVSPETASKDMNAPLDMVLETLSSAQS